MKKKNKKSTKNTKNTLYDNFVKVGNNKNEKTTTPSPKQKQNK